MERVTDQQYRSIDGIEWSYLQYMRQSPLHYQDAITSPSKETDAVRMSRFFRTLVLEPERAHTDYAFFTGKQRRGPEWDSFKAVSLANDRTILAYGTPGARREVESIQALALKVRNHHLVAPLFLGGQVKRVFSCVDAETGLVLKCRPELVNTEMKVWAELKTCRSADPRLFASSASHFGYHLQAAFHVRVIRQCDVDIARALLLPVEKKAPFDVGSCLVDKDVLHHADVEITRMLNRVVECKNSGVWPGRYSGTEVLRIP